MTYPSQQVTDPINKNLLTATTVLQIIGTESNLNLLYVPRMLSDLDSNYET
jgi:hypothetical protein